MRLSPLTSVQSCRHASFGALKFVLDKPTKEYLLKLSKEEGLSAKETLETAESTDVMVHNLTYSANKIAKDIIDTSPLRGKTLEEVWPQDTIVKINIKPHRNNDYLALNAYFNNTRFAQEDSEKTYRPHGDDRSDIKTIDLWSFIGDLKEKNHDKLEYYVEKSLHKNSNFNVLKQDIQPMVEDKEEQTAKMLLKKWLNL